MGKTGIGIVALVIGLVGGTVIGGSLIGGAAAGAGAGVGLSAGICSTVGAAEELGYLTAEQVDEVLGRAAADLAGNADLAGDAEIAGSWEACAETMRQLQQQGG